MGVVGKKVGQLVKHYILFDSFSPDALQQLNAAQRYILSAVSKAGGQNLILTSAYRANSSLHSKNLALDFGGPLKSVYETAFNLKESGYMGGVGLGIPPADRHLHVDARGFDPAFRYRRADGSDARYSYFIETSKPDARGHVNVVPMTYDNLKKIASYYDANDFALARIPEYIRDVKEAGKAFLKASGLTLATVVVWAIAKTALREKKKPEPKP